MEVAEIIASAKDISLAAAGAVTATVAVIGLKSWKRELAGKKEFESAFAFIKATYKLRDQLYICRSPLIRMHEFPKGYCRSSKDNTAEENANAWAHVYRVRREPVWEAVQDFDSRTLEAEALWGQELKDLAEELKYCVRDLDASIDSLLNNELSKGEDFRRDPDFGAEIRANLSATHKEENLLTRKIEESVSAIELFIRPHLKGSKSHSASPTVVRIEYQTGRSFFALNNLKPSFVGIASFLLFLIIAWGGKKIPFMRFVMEDLIWLAVWAVLFSILIGIYLYKTYASSRLGRALLGVSLIINGLIVNISVGPSIERLNRITEDRIFAGEWYAPLLLAIEGLKAIEDIGAIGIAAVGAGVVAACLTPAVESGKPNPQ